MKDDSFPLSQLEIRVWDSSYCIAKFPTAQWTNELMEVPGCENEFFSVTRTDEEISIICAESNLKAFPTPLNDAKVENDWALLQVTGQLEFDAVGIIAGFSRLFAAASIPIFCLSTYNTDYFLVKMNRLDEALVVLEQQQVRWRKDHA